VTGRVLALFLDGPLQSWGNQSRFDRRTSLSYPTRSGVLGLICAALGIDRRDKSGLGHLETTLSIVVYAFGRPSMTTDYHTVGGGYDARTESQNIVPKADGSKGGTVVTYRDYLQDACFGVLVRGEEGLLEELANALNDPRWGMWLGRKSCIPASVVPQGIFDSDAEALGHLENLDRGKATCKGKATRKVTEVERFNEGSDTLLDRPVDFSTREFKPRRVDDKPL
jgi:CRISPR system Cascade subunit CasD